MTSPSPVSESSQRHADRRNSVQVQHLRLPMVTEHSTRWSSAPWVVALPERLQPSARSGPD
jgi:hypothetical protein